jgi:hypothetical protein
MSPSSHKTSHVEELEGRLRERLATQVEIRLAGKDRGQIVISFATNADFERILDLLQVGPVPAIAA